MNHSVYLHIPFCVHRCNYCDFVTSATRQAYIPAYLQALNHEIRIVSDRLKPLQIHSIYFGGGTPSIVPISQYKVFINTLKTHFHVTENCEICLEANPGTLSTEYLSGLQNLGFNRISVGVQSTNPFDLKRLGRIHSIEDILTNMRSIRKVGINNLNLDLIFGLPWQNMRGWVNCLERAIQLNPEHFSLYSLLIEEGTAIYDWYHRGLIKLKDQDLEGEMYEFAMERLDKAGYEQYEISNWAKRDPNEDYRCRHNLQYWLNFPYLGIGAGAHGYVNGIRTINTPNLTDYITRINQFIPSKSNFDLSPANISADFVNRSTEMKDHLLMGLRLTKQGIDIKHFFSRYGESIEEVFGKDIEKLFQQGLLSWGNDKKFLCLSKRGVMVANQVFMHFI